jgi:ATP-dependent DNA helicase RecG
MLRLFSGEMTRQEIMAVLALRDEKHFREHYQQAAIIAGVIEMTIPDKPKSRLQKYRITPKGRALIAQ